MEPDWRCIPNPQGIWMCEDLQTTQETILGYSIGGALVLIAIALYYLGRHR